MMATYVESQAQEGEGVSADDIQDMMVQKAHELFIVCDKESKGFITKRDMQRLQDELPLSPDQLEAVFDSLDDDSNGFLTLEEFTGGFEHLSAARRPYSYSSSSEDDIDEVLIKGFGRGSSFLGVPPTLQHQDSVNSSGGNSEKVYENDELHDSGDDTEHFDDLLSTLGAHGLFEDVDVIKSLWGRIRKDEPEMLGTFEDFLGRVTLDIKRSHTDLNTLEGVLKSKSVSHDEEVSKLYDEMENQIRLEKDRIISEEKAKEKQLRDEMERELHEKEQQLASFQNKTSEMENRLSRLNTFESETKMENEKLMREKEDLEMMLVQSQKHLEESKAYIGSLRQKHKEEKRERAMAALQVSEGIAMERESLVKQLDMLRDMNRRLRDDKDELDMKRETFSLEQELAETSGSINGRPPLMAPGNHDDSENEAEDDAFPVVSPDDESTPTPRQRPHLKKQGSILSSYFGNSRSESQTMDDQDIECDDFDHVSPSSHTQLYSSNSMSLAHELNGGSTTNSQLRGLRNSVSDSEEVDELDGGHGRRRRNRRRRSGDVANGMAGILREQPVGANDVSTSSEAMAQEVVPTTPERVFKVVFVGDSGVGKSSYIHRFCNSEFKATFSATIGVDFQVKSLVVDNHCVALQLWDTAGQERFRSITKQYFRKADGVLVMYDVTSESSFLNVRNWFASVQDGCEEGTVLVLVGNKIDLSDDEETRVVKTKDGAKLADEYGAIFFETSAKSGINVKETLSGMASILREREDSEMEKALQLNDAVQEKKMGCCS